MRTDKRSSHKADKKPQARGHKQGVVGYSKKSALLEEAITHMNTGKYGRSSAALKELLALDPQNTEARRLFATLHLRLGSLVTAREAFESLANEAIGRQDYWLAESLLREYLAAGPRCIPFLELLAHVYEEKGDAMAAVAELGKAIEILLEDPDPDNPARPSQIYRKIRELAPASPVAFQFAASFDIQTGEFRLEQHSDLGKENSPQAVQPVDAAVLPEIAEIMPWEHLEESIPLRAQEDGSLTQTTDVDVVPTVTQRNETDSSQLNPSFTTIDQNGSEKVVAALEIDSSVVQADATSFESIDLSAPIDDPSRPHEQNPELSIKEIAPVEPPSPLPSPMPWEYEADPALQIIHSELSTTASLASTQTSLGESDPVPASTPSTDSSASKAQNPKDDPTLPNEPVLTAPFDEPSIQDVTPLSSSPPTSPPTSFSWNAIFDSAWKFSIGTTAPSSSIVVKEPEASEQPELTIQEQVKTEEINPRQEESTAVDRPSGIVPHSDHTLPEETLKSSELEIAPIVVAEPLAEMKVTDVRPIHESVTESTYIVAPHPSEERTQPVISPPDPFVQEEAPTSLPAACESAQLESIPSLNQVAEAGPEPLTTADLQSSSASLASLDNQHAELAVSVPTEGDLRPETIPQMAAHWNTGEVAVQLHRPSSKKRKWERDQSDANEVLPTSVPAHESPSAPVSELSDGWEPDVEEPTTAASSTQTVASRVDIVDRRPEWEQATDAIVLDQPAGPVLSSQASSTNSFYTIDEPAPSSAASAVDVLFGSTGRDEAVQICDRPSSKPRARFAARFVRARIGLSSLIISCFSTTRAFVLLCLSLVIFSVVTAAVGIGVLALTWIFIEEPPTSRYQSLTIGPQRLIGEPKKNGFLLLMGFDASPPRDPVQTGYERKMSERDNVDSRICMQGHELRNAGMGASSNVIDGWFKGADPLAQFKGQPETIRPVIAQETTSLARYQQWLAMPFDDWGFGQIISPNCPRVLLTHRLFLLEGFNQDTAVGVSRLEKDMDAWRVVLGQSKTLMTKMLAATAVQDDVMLASGLLTRPDTDAGMINRLGKLVRPLDQLELSVRWPMQSYFAWATRNVAAQLKKDGNEERPYHVALAAMMPLPVQRRANAYAEYYDAANKAVAEGRYVNLPKPSQFMRTSASTFWDYWTNPIEHIIGIEPLPFWDPYVGRMVETDARLRLASLQVWVRRGPQDGDVLARLAKAGQAYYDPFTGLPMLVNQKKRLLYSVGRDGKDQEGDRNLDVVVAIPVLQPPDIKRMSK